MGNFKKRLAGCWLVMLEVQTIQDLKHQYMSDKFSYFIFTQDNKLSMWRLYYNSQLQQVLPK